MDSEVERRQDMMLAKNFIERGSAARSCVCHLTCNRENRDNKQRKKKRLQEDLRTSKPKDIDSRETQDCKHKIGCWWCGYHWYRRVRECNGVLVRLIKEESEIEKAEKPSWLAQICCGFKLSIGMVSSACPPDCTDQFNCRASSQWSPPITPTSSVPLGAEISTLI